MRREGQLPTNPHPGFVFLDCEATGLDPPSHPIEVGLAWCDGISEAHLVRPASVWERWKWDPEASAAHHIRREDTLSDGRPVEWMADWLNTACAGHVVCSDNPLGDGYWLRELYRAAERVPRFRLVSAVALVEAALLDGPVGAAGLRDLKLRVARHCPVTHRAADDALFWAVVFREAMALRRTVATG